MFKIRLKKERTLKGWSQAQLARMLSCSQSTIGMWESGKREPNFDMLAKLSELFGCTTDYLTGRSEFRTSLDIIGNSDPSQKTIFSSAADMPQKPALVNAVHIPVYRQLSPMIKGKIVGWELFTSSDGIREEEYFALLQTDNSMSARIMKNDLIIIHRTNEVFSGDLIAYVVNDSSLVNIRSLVSISGECILVQPYNPAFRARMFTPDCVTIIGKVIEIRQKYK